MKKLLLILLCVPLIGLSQRHTEFKDDIGLIVDNEIKINERLNKGDLSGNPYNFFTSENMSKKKKKKLLEKIYVGQIFKVNGFQKNSSIQYIIELENNDLGIVYFEYNWYNYYSFPFDIIGGITIPEFYYCDRISKKEDKFKDETVYRSPYSTSINFTKYVTKDNFKYYLSCRTIGSTVIVDGKGVTLLLDNGEKIEWPSAEIDVDVNNNAQYEYSCFVNLDKSQVEKLKNYNITDFRLYIFDKSIENPAQYKDYLKCIDKISSE